MRQSIRQGDAARDRRDWQQAARHYQQALRLSPRLSAIWVQYGHALKEAGYVVDAELAYRRALSVDRHDGEIYLQLGHVLKMQGRIDDAAEAYKRAYILDSDLAQARLELKTLDIDVAGIVALPKVFHGSV